METTCGNCEHVNFNNEGGWGVFGCKKTGYVIPHHADFTTKEVKFWRIPTECPRSEGVKKSEDQAPQKEHLIKSFKDFE